MSLKTPAVRTIRKWVTEEVESKMRYHDSFTSVDVTLSLRIQHPEYYISNTEVAKFLRNNVINWSYDRALLYSASLITVDSNRAYLYHYHENSPDNYVGRDKTTLKKKKKFSKKKIMKNFVKNVGITTSS